MKENLKVYLRQFWKNSESVIIVIISTTLAKLK